MLDERITVRKKLTFPNFILPAHCRYIFEEEYLLFVTKKFPFSGVKEATEWMFLYLPNDFPPTVRQIKDRGGSPFNAQAPPLFYLLFVLSIGQKRSAPTPSSDQRQRDQQYKRRGSQSGGAAAAAAAARWRGSGGFPHVGDRYFSRGEKFVRRATPPNILRGRRRNRSRLFSG